MIVRMQASAALRAALSGWRCFRSAVWPWRSQNRRRRRSRRPSKSSRLKGGDNLFGALIPAWSSRANRCSNSKTRLWAKTSRRWRPNCGPTLRRGWRRSMTKSPRLYASHFTESELKEMLAFYKSPLGRKMIDRGAKGARQAAWCSRRTGRNKFSDEVLVKIRAEMKKMGHDL